jgi:hypothetical protein
MIAENPDLVERMVRAMQKSQLACADDQEACVQALLNAHPQKVKENEMLALELSIGDWLGPNQECPGQFVYDNWAAGLELLKSMPDSPIAEVTKPIEDYIDDRFVPACP